MKTNILPVLFFALLLIIWQLSVSIFQIQKWILPSPIQIFISLWESRQLFLTHTIPTLIEAFWGFICATILGIIAAVSMKYSLPARKILYPILILSQTIPFIALAPLLVLWFGFGIMPKIIVITIACFFPIAINLFDGFEATDKAKLQLLNSMGATKMQIFKFLVWPGSLPYFFTGLRIASSYAILGAVVAEWVGTDKGLGILLVRSAKSFMAERVFATITVITVLSIFCVYLVQAIERIAIPWHFYKKDSYKEEIC